MGLGGLDGLKVNLLIGGDHSNPTDSVEVVRKRVEQDKVFAIIDGLGEETRQGWPIAKIG